MISMLTAAFLLLAQSYSGPAPAKPDTPYLLHADHLVTTEVTEVKETKGKDGPVYQIAGAASTAKTPLASPIFIMQSNGIDPEKLQVVALTVAEGRREAVFSRKRGQTFYTLTVKMIKGSLYRLEVNESLPVGEYAIAPPDSHQAFCFAVY